MLTNLRLHIETLGVWWCRMQHAAILWPIHGEYRCAECYRRYPVAWNDALGRDLADFAPGTHRARERDLAYVAMGDERCARLVARACDDVQHPRRQAALFDRQARQLEQRT